MYKVLTRNYFREGGRYENPRENKARVCYRSLIKLNFSTSFLKYELLLSTYITLHVIVVLSQMSVIFMTVSRE